MTIANRPPPELAVLQWMMAQPDGPKTISEAEQVRALARTDPLARQKLDLAVEKEAREQTNLQRLEFDSITNLGENMGKSFDVEGNRKKNLAALRESIYGAP